MAYSPIEQGRLLGHKALEKLANVKGVSEAQIAIAWLLHQDNVIVIPKASHLEHVEQNYTALNIMLSTEDLGNIGKSLSRAYSTCFHFKCCRFAVPSVPKLLSKLDEPVFDAIGS